MSDSPGPRLTYDSGVLQIMVPSLGHDNPNRTLDFLVQLAAAETKTGWCPAGSTTFKRPDLRKGFEPDSSFYFRHAAAMNGKS